jgi:ankyrin repeat protein
MRQKHLIKNEASSVKSPIHVDLNTLRAHFEEATRVVVPLTNEAAQWDTDLLEAAKNGDEGKIRELVLKASDISGSESIVHKQSALHLAAQGGYEVLARVALENGADIRQKSSKREKALTMAIQAGHAGVVRLLLEHGESLDEGFAECKWMLALWAAIYSEHVEVVQVLLEYGANPLPRHLVSAVETGREEIVDIFLQAGVGINQQEFDGRATALHVATIVGPSMTKLVLETRSELEPRYRNRTPLEFYLTQVGEINNEVVSLLVEAGAKVSPQSWVNFPSELQEKYADRCPFGSSSDFAPLAFQQVQRPSQSLVQNTLLLSRLGNRSWYKSWRRDARMHGVL